MHKTFREFNGKIYMLDEFSYFGISKSEAEKRKAMWKKSVLDQETVHSAPKVSIGMRANATATDTIPASIKLEHLGGDQIHFEDPMVTQVKASLNGAVSVPINATCLGNVTVGDLKILPLASSCTTNAFEAGPVSGDTVNIKIIDVKNNQLISSGDVKF